MATEQADGTHVFVIGAGLSRIANVPGGAARLPSLTAMQTDGNAILARMHKRYAASPRHRIQVDVHLYLHEIDRERKRRLGLARA